MEEFTITLDKLKKGVERKKELDILAASGQVEVNELHNLRRIAINLMKDEKLLELITGKEGIYILKF